MKRFKATILFIHRWLGLISGLVVFIVSITGCIFCFQDEIQDALHNWRKVSIQTTAYIAPSKLKEIALGKFPGASVEYIYYFGKNRPAMTLVSNKDCLMDVYFNPYTAKITHIEDAKNNFFSIVEYIHLYLLLPAKTGTMVVGISVLIFVILMITGIILWWPRRKTDQRRSLTIKWNGRFRRINYDLHNVLGFYATVIALVLAITGLSMSFAWVNKGIYHAANLGRNYPDENIIPKSGSKTVLLTIKPIDQAFNAAWQHSPNAAMYLIDDPADKTASIGITAYAKSLHYGQSDFYYFDSYSGKLLKKLPYLSKSAGMKLNDLNYDIHVGQTAGLTGKIIAFLASLICASLPLTGLIIWLGKKKKTKTKPASMIVHRRIVKKYRQENQR